MDLGLVHCCKVGIMLSDLTSWVAAPFFSYIALSTILLY
jgi:hypothetical protein